MNDIRARRMRTRSKRSGRRSRVATCIRSITPSGSTWIVTADPESLYRRMIAAQGGGYGACIHTGRFEILSASPELFFRRDGVRLTSEPMKGTARRGRWLEEDDRRAEALAASPKERAENVMIVDLIRNDLSRIAEPATVQATRLFDVHRLPTVLQMTSTVEARVRPDVSTWDIFAALFPCGSVTGAPKIAACRVIADLEDDPRGVYCGAIGHIAPDGTATFSVAIRTLTIDHQTGRAEYGVGGGITWDSAGSAEYDELRAKAAILTDDLPDVGSHRDDAPGERAVSATGVSSRSARSLGEILRIRAGQPTSLGRRARPGCARALDLRVGNASGSSSRRMRASICTPFLLIDRHQNRRVWHLPSRPSAATIVFCFTRRHTGRCTTTTAPSIPTRSTCCSGTRTAN